MSETRTLYVWMLYNWKTSEKRFLENESHGPNSIGEFYKAWTPQDGEKLYMLEGEVSLEQEHPVGSVRLSMVREDDRTRDAVRPGQTVLDYVSSRALGCLEKCLPPGSFGPGVGAMSSGLVERTDEETVYRLSVPGHKFRITVEEIP
jgi:hypothetical protein